MAWSWSGLVGKVLREAKKGLLHIPVRPQEEAEAAKRVVIRRGKQFLPPTPVAPQSIPKPTTTKRPARHTFVDSECRLEVLRNGEVVWQTPLENGTFEFRQEMRTFQELSGREVSFPERRTMHLAQPVVYAVTMTGEYTARVVIDARDGDSLTIDFNRTWACVNGDMISFGE